MRVKWLLESWGPRGFFHNSHFFNIKKLYQEARCCHYEVISVYITLCHFDRMIQPVSPFNSTLLICLNNLQKNCQMTVTYWLLHHAVKPSILPVKSFATPNVKHERVAV